MSLEELQLQYADRVARVWVRRYRVSPVAGRVFGYLLVCDPARQSIDELAAALRASRSAVAGAVKDLESLGALQRERVAGERVDRVRVTAIDESRGFDPTPHQEMAAFAREGLMLLSDQGVERREPLEDMASMGDFLAVRLPQLLAEWRAQRADGPGEGQKLHPGQESKESHRSRTAHHGAVDGNLS